MSGFNTLRKNVDCDTAAVQTRLKISRDIRNRRSKEASGFCGPRLVVPGPAVVLGQNTFACSANVHVRIRGIYLVLSLALNRCEASCTWLEGLGLSFGARTLRP